MTETVIKLAEIPILVRARDDRFGDYFSDFSDFSYDGEAAFTVEASDGEIEAARALEGELNRMSGRRIYNLSDYSAEALALEIIIERELIARGVLRLHASAIAVDGVAYLFTAASGTGKSTHARLWREAFGDRAVMINDDKPLLKIDGGGAVAYGSPWNGKHHLGANVSFPVGGIALLHRSKENRIERIPFSKALPELYVQAVRAEGIPEAEGVLELLSKLGGTTAVWSLGCNMEREAAEISYNAMKRGFDHEVE